MLMPQQGNSAGYEHRLSSMETPWRYQKPGCFLVKLPGEILVQPSHRSSWNSPAMHTAWPNTTNSLREFLNNSALSEENDRILTTSRVCSLFPFDWSKAWEGKTDRCNFWFKWKLESISGKISVTWDAACGGLAVSAWLSPVPGGLVNVAQAVLWP